MINKEAMELADRVATGEIDITEAMLQVMERVAVMEMADPRRTEQQTVFIAKCRRDLIMTITGLMREQPDPQAIILALASVISTFLGMSTDPELLAKALYDDVMAKLDTPQRRAFTETMMALVAAIQAKVAVGKGG